MKKILILPLLALLVGCTPSSGSSDTLPTLITVSPTSLSLTTNSEYNLDNLLTITVLPIDATNKKYNYVSSNTDLFTISNSTLTTNSKTGNGEFTVACEAEKNVKATISVIVNENKPATGVSISPALLEMDVNESKEITATVTPSDTSDTPTWSIIEGNDVIDIAPNNNKVTVTSVKEGEAIVQVKYNENVQETASIVVRGSSSEGGSVKYNIEYDLGTRKTSYPFKDDEADLIKDSIVAQGDNDIISEVSAFTYIYGGGYGGSGDDAWIKNDILKFGTTSVNGELTLSLTKPVNKLVVTGMVGNTTCKVQVGDSNSFDDETKAPVVTCSDMPVASKDVVMDSIEFEFEETTSLKIATTNKKVFYISSMELFYGDVKSYTVRWYNDDGTLLETDNNVIEGSVPTYNGKEPSKEGYVFTGWTPEVEKIYKDTDYTATYVSEDDIYTVTWKNYDGTELEVDTDVIKGSTPSYDGATPVKESTDEYNYIFNGWTPEISPVTEDVTYTATFTQRSKDTKVAGVDPVVSVDGATVEYGFYPQSRVSDAFVINELNKSTSTGWVLYDGNYYVKATASTYNNESYVFNDNVAITNGESYWFKCETIKWTIVDNTNGKTTLLANSLLDSHSFYQDYEVRNENIYPNNYKESDVRNWLNNEFLSTAFKYSVDYIQQVTVDNSGLTTDKSDNRFVCENTSDKVFLPSYKDVSDMSVKTAKVTDYSRSIGAWANTKDNAYKYNGSYWTRSPSSEFYYASWNVNSGGVLSEYAVDGNSHSIRPCVVVSL